MKTKIWNSILCGLLATTTLVGCGSQPASTGETETKSELNVGLVTGIGSIDDKSFNQGSWEGITAAEEAFGINKKIFTTSRRNRCRCIK